MRNGSQYKKFAAECRELARTAKSPEHKNVLLDMATTWDRIAKEQPSEIVKETSD